MSHLSGSGSWVVYFICLFFYIFNEGPITNDCLQLKYGMIYKGVYIESKPFRAVKERNGSLWDDIATQRATI